MKIFFLTFLIAFSLTSCLPTHYIYNPLIIADVKEKGDYNVSGLFTTSIYSKNLHLNSNYAVANNLILQSSITYLVDHFDQYNYDARGYYADFAIGYTNNTSDKLFYIENFIGYGRGNLNNIGINDPARYANFRYNKYFSQLNFNFKINNSTTFLNNLTFHIPLRVAYIHFDKINYTSLYGWGDNSIEYLKENPTKLIISAGKSIDYRLDNFKFSLFISYHTPINIDELLLLNNVYMGAGITYQNSLNRKNRHLKE